LRIRNQEDEMKGRAVEIPVDKIISSTDRNHGGQGNIETLARSIGEHGLIQPPAVKKMRGGHYRVIAGRRRVEAVRSLGWGTVAATVYPEEAEDEAVALAENVNREDMHPLDEAETFRRQVDGGKPVEEIALYYNRSVSAIHHRIRLTDLIDGIRTMFRDGKINITGAALIASLPEEDQEKFLEKFGGKPSVDKWDVGGFMRSARKSPLGLIADGECGACKKRTHNAAPGLFEDYSCDDVCFDGDCYAGKWLRHIAGLIAREAGKSGPTENAVVLGDGIPRILPPKANTVDIGGEEYAVIAPGAHDIGETNRKARKGTAWLVRAEYDNPSGGYRVKVTRVACAKRERAPAATGGGSYDPLSQYAGLISALPEIGEGDRRTVAKKAEEAYGGRWRLAGRITGDILKTVAERRAGETRKGGPAPNWAAIWAEDQYSKMDSEYREAAVEALGPIADFSGIPAHPEIQKMFLFFIVADIRRDDNMPDIDSGEAEWRNAEETLFWKFAGLTRDEYAEMYRERLSGAIAEINGSQGGE